MKSTNLKAIVLKNIQFSDKDKIFTFLTREEGKLTSIAKGVRKISSKRAGNLDTLNLVIISVSRKGNGLGILTEAKSIESFLNIKSSLENSVDAFYMVELVDRFIEEGIQVEDIFELITLSLRNMNAHVGSYEGSIVKTGVSLILLRFQIMFMSMLGYSLNLDSCVSCGKKVSKNWENCGFSYDDGGIFCGDCNNVGALVSTKCVVLMHLLGQDKAKNPSILASKVSNEIVQEADKILRQYVRKTLDDVIRTERVFR